MTLLGASASGTWRAILMFAVVAASVVGTTVGAGAATKEPSAAAASALAAAARATQDASSFTLSEVSNDATALSPIPGSLSIRAIYQAPNRASAVVTQLGRGTAVLSCGARSCSSSKMVGIGTRLFAGPAKGTTNSSLVLVPQGSGFDALKSYLMYPLTELESARDVTRAGQVFTARTAGTTYLPASRGSSTQTGFTTIATARVAGGHVVAVTYKQLAAAGASLASIRATYSRIGTSPPVEAP